MWRRVKLMLNVTVRIPCTRCRVHVWPLPLIFGCIYFLVEYYRTQQMLYGHRHFHYPELPVPFVSVAPLKNVPVSNNSWIVTSSTWLLDKVVDDLVDGGWKMVIVTAGPLNYTSRLKNCIILDAAARQRLKYKLKDFISADGDDVALKNLGYLYAIEHGAQFIYELDGGNVPIDTGHPRFEQSNHTAALVLADFSNAVFNTMDHFSKTESSIRPYREYVTCKMRTPSVQHGMTFAKDETFQKFDIHAPAVVLANNVYATYNSFNTFYKLESFWSLVIVPSNNPDVHRSFWTQRLMGIIGQHLAFFPPNAKCGDLFCAGLKPEDDNVKVARLLQSWKCTAVVFTDCIKELGDFMVKEKIWDSKAAGIIDAWLHDLRALSYEQPNILNRDSNLPCVSEAHAVYFNPNTQPVQRSSSRQKLLEFCKDAVTVDHPMIQSPTFIFDSILLIVIFNIAHYNVLLMVDSILRDHYPNLLYCSPKISYVKNENLSYGDTPRVSIVNITDTYGYYGYECVLRAMEMGYQVDGYMVVGDDVLLNYWKFKSFDLTKVWAPSSKVHGHKFDRLSGTTKLFWWHVPVMGKVKVNQAFQELMDILEGRSPYSSITQLRDVIGKFWDNRKSAGLGDTVIITYPIDTYFLPAIYSDIYYHVLQTFRRYDVFLEFSLTTTLESVSMAEMVELSGYYDWSSNRITGSMNYYNSSMDFLHPVKFGMLFKSRQMKIDYCQKKQVKIAAHKSVCLLAEVPSISMAMLSVIYKIDFTKA